MGQSLKPELRSEIVRLYVEEDRKPSAIAAQLSIGRYAVYYHLKTAGIVVTRKRRLEHVSCEACGSAVARYASSMQRAKHVFCSRECHRSYEAKQRDDFRTLFWSKVDQGVDCWNWTGARRQNGYGQLTRAEKSSRPLKAHRVAYELAYGPIPAGMGVLHHCDNRLCVRPDHLFLGTQTDNMRDMIAKGRATWQKRQSA